MELLTKLQVAKRYRVSTRAVDSWRSVGKLPTFKIGGVVRFRANKLVEMEDRAMRQRLRSSNHYSNQGS